jgi:hypothetical protein
MSTLSANTIARLQRELAMYEAQIDKINALILSIADKELESYSLDTNEARQSAKRWDISKLQEMVCRLDIHAESTRQRLEGLGVMNMNVRRKEGLRIANAVVRRNEGL